MATIKTTHDAKHERLQMRLDAETKGLLRRGANHQHKTLSQFMLSIATKEANRIIEEREVVTLSRPDWAAFYDALNNPPKPNATLRNAFKRYRNLNE